jgi:serine/threonine protein phosphatase PrpC
MSETSTPAQFIDFAGATHVGLTRTNNEDAWWAGTLENEIGEPLLKEAGEIAVGAGAWLAVSDGLGGANAGEIASRIAILETHGVLRSVERANATTGVAWDAVHQANCAIVKASRSKAMWAGMGATLSFLWVEENGALIGQVGDSRIYRLRNGKLEELSPDHSPVGRMRQSGQITEREARFHPGRHVIDQCLGGGDPTVVPDCLKVALEDGDVILLATDGLTDGVSDSVLTAELSAVERADISLDDSVQRLIDLGNETSGRDNVTAIVARYRVAASRDPE